MFRNVETNRQNKRQTGGHQAYQANVNDAERTNALGFSSNIRPNSVDLNFGRFDFLKVGKVGCRD